MKKQNNTEKVPTEIGLGLIADICHKAEKNDSFRKALKKLTNMNQKNLLAFLGEVQVLFGRLKKIVPNILLEPTEHLNTKDFFKTKSEGGIFAYVDNDIFNWFDTEIHNSPAKELAGYEFAENITEENIVGDAKANNIYEEVDFAHIKQVCGRHISKGEKLLEENSRANLFWVRNKKGELCGMGVWLRDGGWNVRVYKFDAQLEWSVDNRSFFRN